MSGIILTIGLAMIVEGGFTSAQGLFRKRRSVTGTLPATPQYARRTSPPSAAPSRAVNLQTRLQQQAEAVISHYIAEFPELAISIAYKDASNDIVVGAGKASGRDVTPKDTFLYGSGTKPFTATAVLRLIDSGELKAADKVSAIIDPYLKAHDQPSLASFFGEAVGEATVLELIRMGSGIRDFEDDFMFDQWVLASENSSKFWDEYPYDAMKWAASPQNSKGQGPLYCHPGNCTAYSSTSFEVAGLVLAAVLNLAGAWYDFDLASALFVERSSYPNMNFPPRGNGTAKLDNYLTVPGTSVASTWENTTVYEQSPSVLGWTCGSMVSSPSDVAAFFYNLLDETAAHASAQPLLSDSSRAEMLNFEKLTVGWAAGYLKYGAGMMDMSYGRTHNRTERVAVQGHEGDTYGFLSSQGYVPPLKGAYSVAANVDSSPPMETMVCYLLQTVTQVLGGLDIDLGCTILDSELPIIV